MMREGEKRGRRSTATTCPRSSCAGDRKRSPTSRRTHDHRNARPGRVRDRRSTASLGRSRTAPALQRDLSDDEIEHAICRDPVHHPEIPAVSNREQVTGNREQEQGTADRKETTAQQKWMRPLGRPLCPDRNAPPALNCPPSPRIRYLLPVTCYPLPDTNASTDHRHGNDGPRSEARPPHHRDSPRSSWSTGGTTGRAPCMSCLDPERDIDWGATEVHGRTWDDLKSHAHASATVAAEVHDFVRDAERIIHNAPFDVAFLDSRKFASRAPACVRPGPASGARSTRWRSRAKRFRASATIWMRCASASGSPTLIARCTARSSTRSSWPRCTWR